MTVDWFTNDPTTGLQPPPPAPNHHHHHHHHPANNMELYLSNNFGNEPPFPSHQDGQNNFLSYLMGGDTSNNTTPSDIVALNSPNTSMSSPSNTNSPTLAPPPAPPPQQPPGQHLQQGVQKSPEEVNECRWIDQTTRQPCGLRFGEVSSLGQHVNSQHVKETPFLCFWENCKNLNHPFSRKYKLIYHIRTHTKEKPHKCPECTKQFTRLESYNLHRKTHMKPASSPASPAPNVNSNPNSMQAGMTSSVIHSLQQQQQQQPPMNVIMSGSVVPGGQMLQNGQLMGPITIMTQPNNFAAGKSPPTDQLAPSTSMASSPKVKVEAVSTEGIMSSVSPSSGIYSQPQFSRPPSTEQPVIATLSQPSNMAPAVTSLPGMLNHMPPGMPPGMAGMHHPGHPGAPPPRFGHQMLRQKMLANQQQAQQQQQQLMKPYQSQPSPGHLRNGHSNPASPAGNPLSPRVKSSPGVKPSTSPHIGSPKVNGAATTAAHLAAAHQASQAAQQAGVTVKTEMPGTPGTGGGLPPHPATSPQLSHSPSLSHPSLPLQHPSNQMSMQHPHQILLPEMGAHDSRAMHMRPPHMPPHMGPPPMMGPPHGPMMGQPPMYMMPPRAAAPTSNRSNGAAKPKNNISVICPICNKIYTNRKALRKHIKGTTCGKSVSDIDKAMDEAVEGPNEPGADPRMAGLSSYHHSYHHGGMPPYPGEQYKRMRYDPAYQEQVRQQQYYLVPMQGGQRAAHPGMQYPPGMMSMPPMGATPPPQMSAAPAQQQQAAAQAAAAAAAAAAQPNTLYHAAPPSDHHDTLATSSSPALNSPGLLSDVSPLSPIKRSTEPNFTALLTDPSMDLFEWSWDPNNILSK